MSTINELINVLKVLIALGVTMRVIYCLIEMMYSEEDRSSYKRKMINIIIFGIIAGIVIKNKKPKLIIENTATKEGEVSDCKLTAMTEAVTRLNELRSSGAISEEEYYATLNKILEG